MITVHREMMMIHQNEKKAHHITHTRHKSGRGHTHTGLHTVRQVCEGMRSGLGRRCSHTIRSAAAAARWMTLGRDLHRPGECLYNILRCLCVCDDIPPPPYTIGVSVLPNTSVCVCVLLLLYNTVVTNSRDNS